jgi:hypothetical protein
MKKLASYFNVSLSAAYKWSAETVRRKTIIMQSGAEPEIIKLIGEISQLCYIFDCKHVVGDTQSKWASFRATSYHAHLVIFGEADPIVSKNFSLELPTAVAELEKIKQTLESFIYGGA